MAFTVTLQNLDITEHVDFQSVAITDTMEVTGDTMNMTIYSFNNEVNPAVGNEVILTDTETGVKEFGGILTQLNREMGETFLVIYSCTVTDYSFLLDRRYLNKVYATKAVSNGANDSMVEDILADLKNASDGDTAGGDQFYTDFYNNLHLNQVSIGPEIRQQIFQHVLPSQALSSLAGATAMIWWIDFDKKINFRHMTQNHATHLPLRFGDYSIYVEGDVTNFYDLRLEETIQGIGTKAIIKDAIIKSLAVFPDEFEVSAREASGGKICKLTKRPFSELDITSVVIERSSVDVATLTQALDDIARDADDFTSSATNGTHFAFVYVGRQGQNNAYVRICPDAIQTGDIIKINYNYSANDDHENIDVGQVETLSEVTGGDGFHEFVFSQGSEIAVTGLEAIDDIAQIILDRKSKIMRRGSFNSFTKGWQAGQIFYLKWEQEGIDEAMWVINLAKRILTPADDASISDNVMETTVTFANIPRGLRL